MPFMEGLKKLYRQLQKGELLPEEEEEIADAILDGIMDGVQFYTKILMERIVNLPGEDELMILVALDLTTRLYQAAVANDTRQLAGEILQNIEVNRVDINVKELAEQMQKLKGEEENSQS